MIDKLNPKDCQSTVWSSSGFHSYQCSKPVKVVRDGKKYCTIHDPERVAAKRQAEREKFAKESEEINKQWAYEKEMKENYPRLQAENKRLRSALEDCKMFVSNKGWGTWPYMEGSDVYTDLENIKVIIEKALQPAKEQK